MTTSTPADAPTADPATEPTAVQVAVPPADPPAVPMTDLVGSFPPARLGNALASEWTKIRTVQSTIWTFATMFTLILGIGVLVEYFSVGELSGSNYLGLGVGGFVVGQLPVVTLGVLVVTSEYGTGMIRTTLTAYPRRASLLTAKALVFFALAFVLGTVAVGLQVLSSMVILGADTSGGQIALSGQGIRPSGGQIVLAVLGGGLYLALIGLFALALGTLLRHSAGAIAAMLGLLLLPFILAVFVPSGWRGILLTYSPINMSAALFGDGTGSMGGWSLLGVLAAATAVMLAGAYAVLLRRDV